jgi:hypothetical protein
MTPDPDDHTQLKYSGKGKRPYRKQKLFREDIILVMYASSSGNFKTTRMPVSAADFVLPRTPTFLLLSQDAAYQALGQP